MEQHQDAHHWPKGTVAILGDLMVSSIKEVLSSNKNNRSKKGEEIFAGEDYIKPVLKQKLENEGDKYQMVFFA